MFTKKLMRSVENKQSSFRTEGHDCEDRVDRLEILKKSEVSLEIGCDARINSEKVSEVIENVTEDENVDETKAQSEQFSASVEKPCKSSLKKCNRSSWTEPEEPVDEAHH